MIPGRIHDSLVDVYNNLFEEVVNKEYVLGDSGFSGVGYVVSGFKSCQVKTVEQRVFDSINNIIIKKFLKYISYGLVV